MTGGRSNMSFPQRTHRIPTRQVWAVTVTLYVNTDTRGEAEDAIETYFNSAEKQLPALVRYPVVAVGWNAEDAQMAHRIF